MVDVFISYQSQRRRAAEHFAEILKHYGLNVWFDYQLIKGNDFAQQIESKIRSAKSLVVLWCSRSVKSDWVREEVFLAKKLEILIPVKIENCELPFGFALADTIDISGWDGGARSYQLDELIDAIENKVGRQATLNRRALSDYESVWRRFGARTLRDFALLPQEDILESVKAATSDAAKPLFSKSASFKEVEINH